MSLIRWFEPKDPSEVDFWELDFSDRMPATDTITAVLTTFVTGPDESLTVDQVGFAVRSVSGRWQGGTAEQPYLITARVTTAQGRTLDKSGYVQVVDT